MAITFKDTAADTRTELGFGTASTLDVGTSANNILQLDASGNLPAVDGSSLTNIAIKNTPAFLARPTSGNSISDNTYVNLGALCDDLKFDTDNGWDNSQLEGKWVVPVTGVYQIMAHTELDFGTSTGNTAELAIYVNGTMIADTSQTEADNYCDRLSVMVQEIITLNADDYVQAKVYAIDQSGNPSVTKVSFISAFKIF
jgi:hypothetical protein